MYLIVSHRVRNKKIAKRKDLQKSDILIMSSSTKTTLNKILPRIIIKALFMLSFELILHP